MPSSTPLDTWRSSSLDAIAFALGLAVAWWSGWHTGDLVWSLWLSSLVVGYSTIVWMICQPVGELVRAAWRDRALVDSDPRQLMPFWFLLFGIASFFLVFFTVHFVGFHYVHSFILMGFFPIDMGPGIGRVMHTDTSVYLEIVRRYWIFLPSAFLTHRAAFLRKPLSIGRNVSASSFAAGNNLRDLFAEPYKNVMRMHVLIFFFFLCHFAGLENFAVYATVYAVYFFPWRLVRRPETQTATALLQ